MVSRRFFSPFDGISFPFLLKYWSLYYILNLIGTSLNLYTYDLIQLMLFEINIESSEIGFDVFHAIKYQYLVRILKNSILFNWISYVVILLLVQKRILEMFLQSLPVVHHVVLASPCKSIMILNLCCFSQGLGVLILIALQVYGVQGSKQP